MSKIRSGFVSNSSSSSFVILGFEIDNDIEYDDLYDKVKKLSKKYGTSIESIYESDAADGIIVGEKIASAIEEGNFGSVDLKEKFERLALIQKEFENEDPIKLYFGSEAC